MQRVWAIVGGQRIGLAVQIKGSFGDSIGIASCYCAKVGMLAFIFVQAVKAKRDIGESSLAVGRVDFGQDAAVGDELYLQALGIGQRIFFNGLAGRRRSIDSHIAFPFVRSRPIIIAHLARHG